MQISIFIMWSSFILDMYMIVYLMNIQACCTCYGQQGKETLPVLCNQIMTVKNVHQVLLGELGN